MKSVSAICLYIILLLNVSSIAARPKTSSLSPTAGAGAINAAQNAANNTLNNTAANIKKAQGGVLVNNQKGKQFA